MENSYDKRIYELSIDTRRQSIQLGRISELSSNLDDSSEDEAFSIFGAAKVFPDIEKVKDKWVNEVESESKREGWLAQNRPMKNGGGGQIQSLLIPDGPDLIMNSDSQYAELLEEDH